MEQLKVIGIEEGVLVVATDTGERFALPVDETLHSQLRRAQRDSEPRTVRVSPKDIQSHIRAGMSAQDVADLLGARLSDVQRYERPVLAEREHIVDQALAVPVLIAGELDPGAQPTFGVAVRSKLADAGAVGERWTSWREETGWIVKLEFTANEVDHDARWGFDPRRSSLSPLNSDATQLSRQGVQEAAIKRAPEASVTSAETADLLEALRRRRGQREPMPSEEQAERESSPVALFDALEPGYDDAIEDVNDDTIDDTVISEGSRRKGRTSMPSWDEIVFGARTEDGS